MRLSKNTFRISNLPILNQPPTDELESEIEFDPFSHLEETPEEDLINEKAECVLSFGDGNSKLIQMNVTYLSLPAGYTCPMAKICLSKADRDTGKITDYGDIRCYAASGEARYPNVRKRNWRNFDLLQEFKGDSKGMASLILRSLTWHEQKKRAIKIFRIHEGGDFYSQAYFDAWIEVAKARPDLLFYAFTKSLHLWIKREEDLPRNFRLVASEGGRMDEAIAEHNFRKAIIVKDMGEAIERKLNIDTNDFLAALGEEGKDFALLIHGTQSKESGMTKQALKNSAAIKAAKNLRVPPETIYKLLSYYTSV